MENKTAPLSVWKQIIYSVGNMGGYLCNQIIVMWAIYYYAPPEERGLAVFAPIAALGIAMTLGRVIDAIADPLVGFWSDRTKSKFGRRIPFVLFGTIPLCLVFVLLWYPPVQHQSMWNVVYAAVILGLFFFFYTVVFAPYLALLPEIGKTKKERINLVTFQGYFGVLGLFVAFGFSGLLIEKYGFKPMAFIMALITLVSFYIPLTTSRESPHTKAKEVSLSFFQAVVSSLKNKPFMFYILCLFFFWLGFNIILIIQPYLVTVIMKSTEKWVGYSLVILLLVAVVNFPTVNFAAKKWGKRKVFLTGIGLLTLLLPLMGTVRKWGFLTPFYQGLICIGLLGLPIAVLLVLPYAILSDVIDYDEKQTGFRREAMYFGMEGLFTKGAIAASSLLATQLLARFGYSATRYLGIVLAGPIAAILVAFGFFIFLKYPFKD